MTTGIPCAAFVAVDNAAMSEAQKSKPRWFHLTPGRFLIGLLVVECLLWLSQAWFAKGWAVLITMATMGAALLLMVIWLAVRMIVWRRFQFSIRSLFVLVLAVAVPFGWLAAEREGARRQLETVEWINKLGGRVRYDWELDSHGAYWGTGQLDVPAHLLDLLGNDFFADVVVVDLFDKPITDVELERLQRFVNLQSLDLTGTKTSNAGLGNLKGFTKLDMLDLTATHVTDDGLQSLKGLTRLRVLWLVNTKISDAGLETLKSMKQLNDVWLSFTKVTDAGAANLQTALPDCKVSHW